ncbi:MAG: hypothetical protein J5742_00585 [Alphaproteobacteria bacterium]|nr:hypothetical protein [Alphaproteobacteria bacterium]
MTTPASFKNTYVIDMEKLSKRPFGYLLNGTTILPIELKNGQEITATEEMQVFFAGRFVEKMVKQYKDLSKILGNTDARTILEYLDNTGKPIMTLYPTNDVDLHTHNWDNIDSNVLPDIQNTINQRKMLIGKAQSK